MNSYKKGSRIEKLLDDWLKERNFVTHRARKNVLWIKGRYFAARNDLFGCFDIIAKNKIHRQNTFYFQVSTDWKYGAARKEIEEFPNGPNDCVVMAKKEPRKPFVFLVSMGKNWFPLQWVEEAKNFIPQMPLTRDR